MTTVIEQASRAAKTALIPGALVLALLIAGCGGGGSATTSTAEKLTPAQIIQKSTPSVVQISGSNASGTGFVVNAAKQLVVTNAHVVESNPSLKIQIGNETSTSPAQLIGMAPCKDLAVVKIVNTITGLKALTIGRSQTAAPGEEVTALGFPESAQSGSASVVSTSGRISQINVPVNTTEGSNFDPNKPEYPKMIIHQAAINHGNSGGPLLNSKGEVIGINTLTNEGAQGQYYSISIDYAKAFLPELEAGKSKARIGWKLKQINFESPTLAKELEEIYTASNFGGANLKTNTSVTEAFLKEKKTVGMFNEGDEPSSLGFNAGLEKELITNINGAEVHSLKDVCGAIESVTPGSKVPLVAENLAAGNDAKALAASLSNEGKEFTHQFEFVLPKE